jgi:UDP-N-acetylglucosamine diphosphorylase/glucosamine-1-phosphate N-acetyltransferase
MRLCVYEDSGAAWLEPIALTRPAFALWCGAERLFERHARQFAANEVGFWTRPELAELWKLEAPGRAVNDVDWTRSASTAWVNARWFPAPDVSMHASPHVGLMDGQIAYAVLPAGESPINDDIGAWLEAWRGRLPGRAVSGAMLNYLWDVVDHNSTALRQDGLWFREKNKPRTLSQVAVIGPCDQLLVADHATIEPFVVADTRGGPVMIDRDAVVHSFSRLEGPCYVGKESWIVGAKLRAGSTIGPCSRIGGEVEASIVQGYANKYHEGFLGHSYIGEWVNLAAATQTSDLRNDYDNVKMSVNGERLATGKSKVGSFIGDHTKTALGALLNTGSTIGAFSNLLPSGSLLPQVVPSFCLVQNGHLQEVVDLRKTFAIAGKVMQRRGKALTEAHRDFYYSFFEATSKQRRTMIRENEMRRLRKSV